MNVFMKLFIGETGTIVEKRDIVVGET